MNNLGGRLHRLTSTNGGNKAAFILIRDRRIATKTAFKPKGMLGTKNSSKPAQPPKTGRSVQPVTEQAKNADIQREPEKKERPSPKVRAQQSVSEKGYEVVTAYLHLKNDGTLAAKLTELMKNNIVGETALRKIVVRELQANCELQDPDRRPTKPKKGHNNWFKLRLKIPKQYVDKFHKEFDPLQVASMGEIGKSWMEPIVETSVQQAISKLEQKLQTL